MDYLRSLSSAAASSLLQKSGLSLPFALGERISSFDGRTIWALHDAVKRDDSSAVSVFVFDSSVGGGGNGARRGLMPLARNALRKLRTIRHPDVLRFVDAVETDSVIYIVTERVRPLRESLDGWRGKGEKARGEWGVWGLHRVAVALAFVNDSCASTHGNVRTDAVFVSATGEWKLGGFELLSAPKEENAVLYTMGGLVPDPHALAPPEVKKSGFSVLKELDPSAADAYALGLLIHTTFNPTLPLPPTTLPPHPAPLPSSRGQIPPALFPSYKRLLNPSPKHRLSPKSFLDLGLSPSSDSGSGGGFFTSNPLIQVCAQLENFSLGSDSERASFLRLLRSSPPTSLPAPYLTHKLLPSLLSSLEHVPASAPLVLPLVLDFAKAGELGEEGEKMVLGPVVRLFASQDRGVRMALLERMEEFAGRLDGKAVMGQVWPHLQTGFTDTVALIREATLRSIPLIAPKLSDRVLNNDLLRHLAKTQLDPEPSIRTNTVILIGRLAPSLSRTTRQKMLVPAFARAIKDGFVHARVAGLMAFMAVAEGFGAEEVAGRVLPVVVGALVDKEKLVRDQAFKAVDLFMKRLEAHAAAMPDTVLPPPSALGLPGQPASAAAQQPATVQAQLVSSAAGAAGALAGWAMSSLSKQLAATDLGGTLSPERPTSAPPVPTLTGPANPKPNGAPHPSIPTTSLSPPIASVSRLPPSTQQAPKGMQLRAQTVPADKMSALLAELAEEGGEEGGGGVVDAWDGDLMDVNADADDWSAFEVAPIGKAEEEAEEEEENPWAEPAPAYRLSTAVASPQPKRPTPVSAVHVSPPPLAQPVHSLRSSSSSAQASRTTTPAPAPKHAPAPAATDTWGDFGDEAMVPATTASSTPGGAGHGTTSLAGLSPEDKAAEMARRREERKQRIAQAKERKGAK